MESVVCVSISASLALVVSGARRKPRNLSVNVYMFVCLFVCLLLVDGNCLVHNTSGELLHKLVSAYNWLFPHLIAMTTRGHVVVHYADQKGCIAVFSCNGSSLHSVHWGILLWYTYMALVHMIYSGTSLTRTLLGQIKVS